MVTSWTGQDDVHRAALEREQEHLLEVERRWLDRGLDMRSLLRPVHAQAILVALVVVARVGLCAVESMVLPGPALRLQDVHTLTWWAILAGLPLVLSSGTCALYVALRGGA